MSSLGPEASWGQSRRQGMNRLPYLVGENACSHWSQQTRGLRCSVPGWVTRCVIHTGERRRGGHRISMKSVHKISFEE